MTSIIGNSPEPVDRDVGGANVKLANAAIASAAIAASLGAPGSELAMIATGTAAQLAAMPAGTAIGYAVEASSGAVFAPGAALPQGPVLYASLRVALPERGGPGPVLDVLAGLAGTGWRLESLPALHPHLDRSLKVIRARPDDFSAAPAAGAPDGAGVLLGVVDFGCDFGHPAFLDAQGRTRLAFLWDQNAEGGDRLPGAMRERAEIDAALQAADPYQALGYWPDRYGYAPAAARHGELVHGTHVLGVAGGRGTADCPAGVAPGATLAFVHLRPGALVSCGDPADVFDGVCAVFHRADALGMAAVVNLSLGANSGSHDGNTLYDRALDAVLARPGRAITVSAGNERESRLNVDGEVVAGAPVRLVWHLDPGDRTQNTMRIFSDAPGGAPLLSGSVSQDGVPLSGALPPGRNAVWLSRGGEVMGLMYAGLAPSTGAEPLQQIEIRIKPSGREERLEVVLATASAVAVRFDAWIDRDDRELASQSRFDVQTPVTRSTLACTACGRRTICVGAFDHRAATLPAALFSSEGLTRDERQKPDVCAPGLDVLAAAAYGGRMRPGSRWRSAATVRMSGTSAAAPHVAGVLALMLQVSPGLVAEAAAEILRRTSRLDAADGGGLYHPQLGSGRIDAAAALARVMA